MSEPAAANWAAERVQEPRSSKRLTAALRPSLTAVDVSPVSAAVLAWAISCRASASRVASWDFRASATALASVSAFSTSSASWTPVCLSPSSCAASVSRATRSMFCAWATASEATVAAAIAALAWIVDWLA